MSRARHPGDRLAALADDHLDDAERDALLLHLAGCPQCRADYAEQRAVRQALGGLATPLASDSLARRLATVPAAPASPVTAGAAGTEAAVPSVRPPVPPRSAPAQRVHTGPLLGAGLLSLAVVGLVLAYAAGAAAGPEVVPPTERFVREHAAVTAGLALAGSAVGPLPASVVLPAQPAVSQPAVSQPTVSQPTVSTSADAVQRVAVGAGGRTRALALLGAALAAPDETSYSGVLEVSERSLSPTTSATATATLRVTHTAGRGTVVTGSSGSTFAPASAAALRISSPTVLDLVRRSYRVVVVGAQQVAGRPATVVEARRTGGSAVVRFWLDDANGLLLRRETRDARTVRRVGFVRLDLDAPPPMHPPPAAPVALGDPAVAGTVAGTQRLGGLTRLDVRTLDAGTDAAADAGTHATYSDGIAAVSVFAQPGSLPVEGVVGLAPDRVAGWPVLASTGLPDVVTWSAAGVVYTVVADAPAETIEAAVAGLPHEPAPTTPLSRLERGASRVLSWLNPSQ